MQPDAENQLLKQLEGEDRASIVQAAQKLDHLSPDEHDGKRRASTFYSQKHWLETIGPWVNWLKFAVLIVAFLVICWLVGSVLWDVRADLNQRQEIIQKIYEFALVALATLFLESKIDKR